jgi:hypothetical protein
MPTERISLEEERRRRWHQTPETHISDSSQAIDLIRQFGIVTHYPASPDIPNLFYAFTGSPDTPIESSWDSPTGQIYPWRWEIGRQEAAFYTALVRKRPTWISWDLLPAILKLCGDLRSPEELYTLGLLSTHALRIAEALEEAGGVLSTGELRKIAGFPTGKEQRATFLKAIEELDTRLISAKVFTNDGDHMSHALVQICCPEPLATAQQLERADAIKQLLLTYLPHACYIQPDRFAKSLKLPAKDVTDGVQSLVTEEKLVEVKNQAGIFQWKG